MQSQFHQMLQQFPNGVGLNPQKIGQASSQPQTFVSSSQHGRIMNPQQQQQYPISSQSATVGNSSHAPYPQAQQGKQQQSQQPQQQQQPSSSSAAQQQQQQPIHQQSHQISYIQKKVIQGYSYCLTDLIGKGYSSQVFRGKNDSTDEVVAIKVIDMKGITNEVQSFLLKNEINVLNKLNSNINCLKLFDVFQTANNTYIITEFCDHGDLKDLINKYGAFSERHAVRILKNILNGMTEMQNKGIIHRDLKLANILVRDGIPKIADFGFSKDLNSEPCKIYYNVGTPMYMSPQSLTKNEYSYKSDIWAVGVLFYEMMFGCTPWTADTEQQLVDKMQTIPVSFPPAPSIAEDTKDLIRRCLEVDEHNRLSLSEMLIHPVFNLLEKKDQQQQQQQQQHSNNSNSSNVQKVIKGDKTPDNKNKENMTGHSAILQGQKNWEGIAGSASAAGHIPTGASQLARNKVMQEKIVQGQQQPQQQQQQQQQYNPAGAGLVNNTGKTPATPSHKDQSAGLAKQSSLTSQSTTNNIDTSSHNLQNHQPSQQQQQLQPSKHIIQEQHTPQQNSQLSQSQQQSTVSRSNPFEYFSSNDQVILAQINFCRFLYRLHKLCIETRAILTDGLQEKLAFLIMKNIMIKLHKLTQMADQKINHFSLPDFNSYIHEESFGRFQIVIREYQAKYSSAFNRLWDSLVLRRDVLITDAKFSTVFDSQFSELETFYIILQGYLRQSAHELFSPLVGSLSYLESSQQLPSENQEAVVFLDYLITYYQLSQIILEHFNEFNHFAKVTKIESIAEGKPVLLSKFHFNSIQNKILTLKM